MIAKMADLAQRNNLSDPDIHLSRLLVQEVEVPFYHTLVQNLKDLINPPKLPPGRSATKTAIGSLVSRCSASNLAISRSSSNAECSGQSVTRMRRHSSRSEGWNSRINIVSP